MDFGFTEKTMPKTLINIGALMDVPTASLIIGPKGDTIMNGGLGQVTGVVGAGNNYKSTILHYMMLSASNRVLEATETAMTTYDTEVNISMDRLETLASNFKNIPKDVISGDKPLWSITDKSMIDANKWIQVISKYSEAKSKDKKNKKIFQPFIDPYSKKPLEVITPSFVEIDSLTEFEAGSTIEMLSNDLDSSDTNTYAMKQGGFKTKFLSQLPRISNHGNIYFLMTAHIGEKIDMATGPAKYNQPTKKLQYLKGGDSIKGVSPKFFFLLNNAWFAHTASVLKNQSTKLPEYPSNKDSKLETELNTVKLTQLRSKSGPSGYTLELVVSQNEGVLPALTEFHFIKQHDRFGISGSPTHYNLDLLPEVSLSRTTVRGKIDEIPKLRRALNITAELLQLHIYHPYLSKKNLLCTAKELYDDIVKLGYDWDILLRTREYWTINQYDNPVPYLGTVDLLKMRTGSYFPYFLNDDKTIKKEYKGIMDAK